MHFDTFPAVHADMVEPLKSKDGKLGDDHYLCQEWSQTRAGEGGCHKTHHSNGGGGVQHNTVRWGVVKTHHLEMRGGGS